MSYWAVQSRLGRYEVDALLGYLAGVPTYSLLIAAALSLLLRETRGQNVYHQLSKAD